MAATIADTTPVSDNVAGRLHLKTVTITGDSSYPTGGYALTPAQVGFTSIVAVLFSDASALGVQATYDYTNQKVKLFWTGAGLSAALAEVTNATNVSTAVLRALIIGY